MRLKTLCLAAAGAAMLTVAGLPAQAAEQYVPLLVYKSGPYAPNGIPMAAGWEDYIKLINARDGGVNGVKLVTDECDTGYNNDRGVECYERLKKPTAAAFQPLSTGITYALLDRVAQDKIPLYTGGYGRTSASYGPVFPYVFTAPLTYWSGADIMVQYAKGQEGGSLKGKKIALVYHDSAYGKEPIPTLERLSKEEGFEFYKFPVAHPGLEQKSTWLQIGRQVKPDWVFMWGWGVMNSTAVKEAAAVGYPMDHFIGIWWSGAEPDVVPAGAAAKGYKALGLHLPGTDIQLLQDVLKYVYNGDEAKAKENAWGTVLYNRGLFLMAIEIEAIRQAQEMHGKGKELTGEQIRDGFENLNLTEDKLAAIGLKDFTKPIHITCEDHEGGGQAFVQQWDGEQWKKVSDWFSPHREALRAAYKEDALAYAKEKGITPRTCK
ncbi:amino acid/amide ABC transporter substrate-binding protein, HAAT family [Tistlia consotensis]|uniref:Amino acid/amide ABC transporter substrate-binding protein, HAAT family n=1 Tax=Tistlia consotensis USBA 355 TaxID=560819 RepID=A0A1Y6BML1_9PROT|nr:ABC transporter substrate-binding protein [Tistlia consotensis]SMF11520.1 amino acid/amide ABC transporter substrate-binding protein, HAAT family [Tistlia consotensis USBA 355]SNR51884.1 amino acid/amide ABC transporter substrate-binding protein, HAAT family [Tistlia consotensis]